MIVNFIKNLVVHFIYASAVCCLWVGNAFSAQETIADSDESRIYGILIDAVSERPVGSWVMVGADTASFECNPPAPIGINIDGCSGMRDSAETPMERMAIIRRDLPLVTDALATEFLDKCKVSTKLTETIPTKATYHLWSTTSELAKSLGTGNPEIAVFFSRVAFDGPRTTALVYLGKVHWANSKRSVGQYVVLKKVKNEWQPMGASAAWSFN